MTDAIKPSPNGTWRETPKSVFKRLRRPESPKDFLRRMSREQQAATAVQQQQQPPVYPGLG
ncbi:MAG: hypothetical protein NT154_23880 [Verrucomicrobia bacterium]|nr:hypothetical protein [Verrucomicrobiota bacterium]